MKTTTDIAAFLKRITAANANTAAPVTMCHDGKVFIVKVADMSTRSQYLDDALENLAEETRRRANNMQPVRETKPEPKPAKQYSYATISITTPPVPIKTVPTTISFGSVPQTMAACGTPTGTGGTCPQCNQLMIGGDLGGFVCAHGHMWPASSGRFVLANVFGGGNSGTWDFDANNNTWTRVSP